MIPPWVRPETPEILRIIDDATNALRPTFGRGMTQRGIWADPRWGLRRRYRGLRSDEKVAILNALLETRGQLNVLRITPHSPMRGSFATSELAVNNTFASGTTGWALSGGASVTLSASDRTLRLTRADGATSVGIGMSSAATVVQYAPYVARAMFTSGRGPMSFDVRIGSSTGSGAYATTPTQTAGGLISVATVVTATTAYMGFADTPTGKVAGDYSSVSYASFARCALVDSGTNMLLRSDEFDNATWQKNKSSASANSIAAPFDGGTVTGDTLVEDNTSGAHYFFQTVTVPSSTTLSYAFSVCVFAGSRNFVALEMGVTTGNTVNQYFNLATGAVGTTGSSGSSWSNRRAFIRDMGGGWYMCTLVAAKVDAGTSVNCVIYAASADGTASYLGTSSSAIYLWRATLAQSSVPTRLVQTTTAASSGTTPTGGGMYTKGWPASTSGLMLAGDWFEWGGELKQLTAAVNSDASGLAYMQFRPGLAGSPTDNDPIVIQEPFGRFIYPAGAREVENQFGIYADCTMELEEVYV